MKTSSPRCVASSSLDGPFRKQSQETAERENRETQIPINLIVARRLAPGYMPGIGFQKWDTYLKD